MTQDDVTQIRVDGQSVGIIGPRHVMEEMVGASCRVGQSVEEKWKSRYDVPGVPFVSGRINWSGWLLQRAMSMLLWKK